MGGAQCGVNPMKCKFLFGGSLDVARERAFADSVFALNENRDRLSLRDLGRPMLQNALNLGLSSREKFGRHRLPRIERAAAL